MCSTCCAVSQRLTEKRRRERVVNDKARAHFARNLRAEIKIADLQQRVRDRLCDQDTRAGRACCGAQFISVTEIRRDGFNLEYAEDCIEQTGGRAVEVLRGEDGCAGRKLAGEQGGM